MSILRVEQLTGGYGRGPDVLHDVSFSVEPGTVTAILGPSGSGKSTLLRLLAGLETPRRGRIHVDGKDVSAVRPGERGVAMVFQDALLYPHMTVRGNLEFAARQAKVTPDRSALEAVADRLGIADLLKRRPSDLSGGERQRAATARAMVTNPKMLFLDEPLAHVDPPRRATIRDALVALRDDGGRALLWVTHDYRDLDGVADQIIVLDEGRVVQSGSAIDVRREPARDLVRALLDPFGRGD